MPRPILLAPLALCACATAAPPPPPNAAPGAGVCRNEALEGFAGREATGDVGSEILRASGARVLQWIQPGMMVTMEFREDRVRVWLAPGNRIQRVVCG